MSDPSAGGMPRAQAIFWVFMSVLSSVTLVSINKVLFSYPGWSFHNILVTSHLLATWGYTVLAARLGYYDPNAPFNVPLKRLLTDSGLLVLSILSMNWTLETNTVSFYQLTKLLMVPSQCLMQFITVGSLPNQETLASLVLLVLGLAGIFVTDLSTSMVGFLCASTAVISTTVAQSNVQTTQTTHGVGSLLYLRHISYYQTIIAAIAALITDLPRFDSTPFASPMFVFLFLLSCCMAFLVNACSFVLIGKFSALTYQVIGHSKTVLVLAIGFVVFGNPLTFRGAIGLIVAGAGVWWYTAIKVRPPSK
eukprot:ANDGO_07825.mRNA.1 UDP-galactose transporter 2